MTEALYHRDSYAQEFTATVTEVVDNGIVLDRTAFYPGGGGQPYDVGILQADSVDFAVTRMSRKDGKLVHELDKKPPAVGTKVTGKLDWDRRYKLMRTHTALHLLCGVVWRDYGAQVTGGDMQPLQARMDFELETIDAAFAKEIEAKVNAEIAAARQVTARVLPREEAFTQSDLIRTKINLLPAGITEVRVVEIKGLDLQADGGTHVSNTREVGSIKVVGHESKGRINKRLRIQVE